jgi:peptidoglycan/LPS O-acetylase OafA/YrhL
MSTTNSTGREVHIIGTLRALAAVMVSFYHFVWHSDPTGYFFAEDNPVRYYGYQGQVGVYVFFVISGFIIPYAMFYGKYSLKNFWRFLSKRLLRLHPPFIASMLLFAVLAIGYAIKEEQWMEVDWPRIIHNFFLTAKFVDLPWYEDVYWTLAIEFQYYVLVALIFPLIAFRKQWISFVTLMAFVLSARFFDHETGKHFIFFHAPVFAAGIAVFMQRVKLINDFQFIVLLGWCMIEARYEIGPEVAVALALTAASIVALKWYNKVTDFLGDISYSLYLIHGFVGCQFLYFTARYAVNIWEKLGLLLFVFAISVGASWLFYKAFEVPAVRWSKKIKYK